MSDSPSGASTRAAPCAAHPVSRVVRSCQAHPRCSLTDALASPKKVPILYFLGRTEAPKQHSSPQGLRPGVQGRALPWGVRVSRGAGPGRRPLGPAGSWEGRECHPPSAAWQPSPRRQSLGARAVIQQSQGLWLSFWSQGGLAGVGRPGAFHPTMAAQAYGHTAES